MRHFKKKEFREFTVRSLIFSAVLLVVFPLVLIFLDRKYSAEPLYSFTSLKFSLFGLMSGVLFIMLNKSKLFDFEYRQNFRETVLFSFLSIILLLSFFSFTRLADPLVVINNFSVLVLLGYFTYFLAVFFVFLAVFNFNFFREFFSSVSASFLVSVLFFFFTVMLWANWRLFSNFMAKASYVLMSVFSSNAGIVFTASDPVLKLESFSVAVGAPCSGIESTALFTGLFLVMISYDWQRIIRKRILPIFLLGIAGIFIVSLVRIFALMLIGAKWSPQLALTLFHANAGWVLFVAYFLAFVIWIYPMTVEKGVGK
ncbi:MAG TPA: archaeosortase/exosortase family protein [Candidatus Nanoarchaeia archaeon]|nr:archaeosortase/exosortase family protein [Candidatus Nanoarchaeia archaeon]